MKIWVRPSSIAADFPVLEKKSKDTNTEVSIKYVNAST